MSPSTSSQPIRILHVCTIALTAHVFIAPIARYLTDRGYQVAVACSPEDAADGPDLAGKGYVEGVPIFPVAIPRAIRPLVDFRAIWHLARLMRAWKPHIVHTQTSKAGGVGRLAAWLARVPIVVHTAHAFPFHSFLPAPARAAYVRIERWAARMTDLIMVDTDSVREEGIRHRIVDPQSKLVTVPMGLDLKKFSPSREGSANLRSALGIPPAVHVVGTVARLVPDKGIDCFLRMAGIMAQARNDIRFLVVGDGPLRGELENLAVNLDIRSRVLFTGHRSDVPDLIRAMDVFVLPTRREGFGVVFAEAMAVGTPAIGSRIGPIAEVMEDLVTGYLADPANPEEFATRALELLGDERKRRAFGEAGRRRVEKLFSQERMCEVIEGHYQRLLRARGLAA